MTHMPETYLTYSQASAWLKKRGIRMAPRQVGNLVRAGRIKAARISGKIVLIPVSELERVLTATV